MAIKRYTEDELIELVRGKIQRNCASPELIYQSFGKRAMTIYRREAKKKGGILSEPKLDELARNVAKGAFDRLNRITNNSINNFIPRDIKDNNHSYGIDIAVYETDLEKAADSIVYLLIKGLIEGKSA